MEVFLENELRNVGAVRVDVDLDKMRISLLVDALRLLQRKRRIITSFTALTNISLR